MNPNDFYSLIEQRQSDRKFDPDRPVAAAHITLAATAEGLGSCIIGWVNEVKIREILGIPSGRRVVMNIMLGYSADPHRAKKRKETSEVLHREKW